MGYSVSTPALSPLFFVCFYCLTCLLDIITLICIANYRTCTLQQRRMKGKIL